MGQDPDELRAEIAETRERMGDTADAIAYKADVPHRMQDAVGEKMDQMKSAITGSVGQARRAVSRAGDAMPDTDDMRTNAMNAMSTVRENPLGLFFGMAAVGFVIGSLLPVTQLENDQLAPVVDQLKARAKDRVQETIETARDAAVSSISDAIGVSS
ncbi:MAG: DUF3618 domain-containing protein [Candidatus Eremiobacteraeota bacterium]|nr:DUF3618 domain-containing protein [Candidatus Eremiobacteraeota bacterium]